MKINTALSVIAILTLSACSTRTALIEKTRVQEKQTAETKLWMTAESELMKDFCKTEAMNLFKRCEARGYQAGPAPDLTGSDEFKREARLINLIVEEEVPSPIRGLRSNVGRMAERACKSGVLEGRYDPNKPGVAGSKERLVVHNCEKSVQRYESKIKRLQ